MKGYGVTIAGVGQYAPPGILANKDFEKLVDTTDEWIVQRTGMKRRHIAADHEATSDIALPAARAALEAAGKLPADLDCVVVATATPDYPFPATACILASRLGLVGTPAFDVQVACSGFVYGLTAAAALVRSGVYKTVLLLGAETLSKITDYTDRTTCVLFGDGVGAVVLERSDADCFLGCNLGTDGSDVSALYLPVGGSRNPSGRKGMAGADRGAFIRMQGQSVFKLAVQQMVAATLSALDQAGLAPADVDFLIPHQANLRIIDATVKALKLPVERCVINIQEYGNTSSASIPMALAEAVADGRIKDGQVIVFAAFGGGLSWGAVVWRWKGARARIATQPAAVAKATA
ncbi:MAG: ketoacyl-ACP synthase III [Candidatus Eremiobacteraeota bacterium]|nr:ketoacyl-ACP synthase III [Candidatus Eremiobacteraeota bacterium]MBC5826965.1 ketoacyl-ACP synthase III [Candidatus Eremiobacteraeota bacterium]